VNGLAMMRAMAYLFSCAVAAMAQAQAAADDPAPEPFEQRAQAVYWALTGEDCKAYLKEAEAIAAHTEFAERMTSTQRVAYLWQLLNCAHRNREYELALSAADRAVAIDSSLVPFQWFRLLFGPDLGRPESALDAFRTVASLEPKVIIANLEVRQVFALLRAANRVDESEARALEVHETLLRVGYAPPPPASDEALRMGHARLLLRRGRVTEARERLEKVLHVENLVSIRIDREFDPLREDPAFEARLDLAAAMARNLEDSRELIEAHPKLLEVVYRHMQDLDKAQRNEEALALADAALARLGEDPEAYSDADEYRPWILNDRAYLLYELGRREEGEAALREGAKLTEGDEPNVSQSINLAGYLIREGRAAEALALVGAAGKASPYGDAWIASVRSCAGALLNDEALRVDGLKYLEEHVDDNPQAFSRALLCSNDLDGAAALMIRRLERQQWRGTALEALQITPRSAADELPFQKLMTARFDLLRDRADVRRAVEAVGRIEVIPFDIGSGD
jgi:tetratricopeptide (TPR) repeat protein